MKLYDRLIRGLAAIACGLVLAIMVGIAIDVAGRFLLGHPVGWVLEFTEHALLCILFLGMPWLAREGGHVAVELLVDAMPPRLRRAMLLSANVIAAITSLVLGVAAAVAAVTDFQRGAETFGIYPIPRGLLFAVVCLGFLLTAVEFLRLRTPGATSADAAGSGAGESAP